MIIYAERSLIPDVAISMYEVGQMSRIHFGHQPVWLVASIAKQRRGMITPITAATAAIRIVVLTGAPRNVAAAHRIDL